MKKFHFGVLLTLIASTAFAAGFDGNGNYVRSYNWTSDAANGIDITASRFDTEDDGFAAGLSICLTRDGQGRPSADIPWNSHKITNLGTPSVSTDAANKAYVDSALTTYSNYQAGLSIAFTQLIGAASNGQVPSSAVTQYSSTLFASPALTGSPTAPTQTAADNTTKIATTAFVTTAVAALPASFRTGVITLTGNGTSKQNGTLSFSSAFPTGILAISGNVNTTANGSNLTVTGNPPNVAFDNFSTSGCRWRLDTMDGSTVLSNTITFTYIAVGH